MSRWPTVAMHWLCTFVRGHATTELELNNTGEGVRYLRTSDLLPGVAFERFDTRYCAAPPIDAIYKAADEAVITIEGFQREDGRSTVGVACWSGEGLLNNHVVKVQSADPRVSTRFAMYSAISAPNLTELRVSAKGAISASSGHVLERLRMIVPPLEEQRRIADFLDDQVAFIDQAVAAQDTQRALLLERFQSLLASRVLFDRHKPDTSRSRVKFLFEYERNGIWGSDSDGGPDDVPCVRVADFDRERFIATRAPTVRSVPRLQRLPRLLRHGDVLLEKSGGTHDKPVGCAVNYMSKEPAVCSNFVAALRPTPDVVPRFAGLVMAALYQTRRNSAFVNQTTGIQNIDSSAYLAQEIRVPNRRQQELIVRDVESESDRAQQLMKLADRRIRLLEERKQALITAAVTGQLDVTTARAVA